MPRLLDERAKEVAASELDEYLLSGYGIFAGRKVQWATPAHARSGALGLGAELAPEAALTRGEGRQLRARLPYAEDRELVMEILKYGADVEVLSLDPLRKRVRDALRAAAKRYAD